MTEQHLFDLLARHGTPLLFLLQMFGVFAPIPDELLLTIAGALIQRGDLSHSATIGAAIAGSLTGITVSYSAGRLLGPRVIRRLSVLDAKSLARGQAWFKQSGKWLLAFSSFVPGVRHIAPLAAGSAALEFRAFAAYAYPGVVIWSSIFVAAGYYAGDRWERAVVLLHGHLIIVPIVFTALALGYIFMKRHALRGRTRSGTREHANVDLPSRRQGL